MKLQAFLVRREGMTHEAFREYWLTEHVPLAKRLDGLRGYRTSLPLSSATSPYDGIAELYFDDVTAFEAVLGPESRNPAIDDVGNFEARSDRHLVTETVHFDDIEDRTRSAKLVVVFARSAEGAHDAFTDGWLDGAGSGAPSSVRKVTTAVPVDSAEADYDGITEVYFEDVDALRTVLGSDESGEAADLDGPLAALVPEPNTPPRSVTVHAVEERLQLPLRHRRSST